MRPFNEHQNSDGVTMVEVMVAVVLVALALGNIFAITTQSLQALRTTRQVAGASRVLQQRIELIRSKPWPEIANATALAALMQVPTESEKELADADLVETVAVSVPPLPGASVASTTASFRVERRSGSGSVIADDDLGGEPVLMVEITASWRNVRGPQQRQLRTLVCRSGLTRSGVFGSAFGKATPPSP